MSYICHSGGCPGSDMKWENEGNKYGVKTIAYSFGGHKQEGKNREILSTEQLNEGFQNVLIANKAIKRYPQGQARYIQNLLSRNWYQVKNAEAVFAVGKFTSRKLVSGGTGWAVQMSIDNQKPTYVFDQEKNNWNKFNYVLGEFEVLDYIPTLTENFAGVGTREINDNGVLAIEKILEYNFRSGVVA